MIDNPEGKRGRAGERAIAILIQRRGGYIVPSYDYSGLADNKPPRLCGSFEAYTIPDLDVSTPTGRIWLEVKTYTQATYYRKGAEWQHGIRRRLWQHYCAVEQLTHTPVWICIYELDTQDIRVAAQKDLASHGEFRNDHKGGQFYFTREALRFYASMNDYPDILAQFQKEALP